MTPTSNPPASSPQQSLRIFFCGHEQTPASHTCGPGIWPHYLLHYVLSGNGVFRNAGQVWRLHAGDAFLIIPGIVASYGADPQTPWEYCWVGFDGRDAKDILTLCGLTEKNPVYRTEQSFGQPMDKAAVSCPHESPAGACLLTLNESFYRDTGNIYLHLSLLYRFFSLLAPQAGASPDSPSGYIRQATEYIRHNYAYDIKIQDIAHNLGIDRSYLYKLFSRELCTSPQQFLIDYRLHMAKHLLSSTTLHISEIANSCGFTDSASFCRHFRAQFSITPSQFRREPGNAPVKP